MASFPGPKVKRPSQRKLGRGQHTPRPQVIATPTAVLAVVTINFSVPVIVNGTLNLHVAGISLVSQVVNSQTQITQTFASTVVTHAWSIAGNDPAISTFQGGTVAAASGTF